MSYWYHAAQVRNSRVMDMQKRTKPNVFESEYDRKAERMRLAIIEFLQWNDPNGVYLDECPENEGNPMSLAEAAESLARIAGDES